MKICLSGTNAEVAQYLMDMKACSVRVEIDTSKKPNIVVHKSRLKQQEPLEPLPRTVLDTAKLEMIRDEVKTVDDEKPGVLTAQQADEVLLRMSSKDLPMVELFVNRHLENICIADMCPLYENGIRSVALGMARIHKSARAVCGTPVKVFVKRNGKKTGKPYLCMNAATLRAFEAALSK